MSVGIIGLALQGANFLRQRREARRAESARVESQAVQTANQETRDIRARRRNARQERIRRARLIQSSTVGGTSTSSAQTGALAALSSNTGAAVANQRADTFAVQGITAASQREARAISSARSFKAFTDFAQAGLEVYDAARS